MVEGKVGKFWWSKIFISQFLTHKFLIFSISENFEIIFCSIFFWLLKHWILYKHLPKILKGPNICLLSPKTKSAKTHTHKKSFRFYPLNSEYFLVIWSIKEELQTAPHRGNKTFKSTLTKKKTNSNNKKAFETFF